MTDEPEVDDAVRVHKVPTLRWWIIAGIVAAFAVSFQQITQPDYNTSRRATPDEWLWVVVPAVAMLGYGAWRVWRSRVEASPDGLRVVRAVDSDDIPWDRLARLELRPTPNRAGTVISARLVDRRVVRLGTVPGRKRTRAEAFVAALEADRAHFRRGTCPNPDLYGQLSPMTATDDLIRNNEAYASSFAKGDLPMPPATKVAVVACMDARLDVARALGLEEGDAHVIHNAGGVVTDDEIRSLAISQRLLGTEEIILIHHTDCGMLTFSDEQFAQQLLDDTGQKPTWASETFTDLDDDVRQSVSRIRSSPFVAKKDNIRGFVYEVETGKLREVS